MAAWNSSSLAVSEGHNKMRHKGNGLLLNTKGRKSKQEITAKMMFGSRRGKHGKDLQIGKKFSAKGKKSSSTKGISPSDEEFDSMMSEASKSPKKGASRKFFG